MIKNKFFEVIKTFSDEDFVKFGQFINSDYFNPSLMLRKLYSIILENTPRLSDEKLTREYFFHELYPEKEYREATILNLLSGLYKLSEEYIAHESYKSDTLSKERYLLKGLGSRKLYKFLTRCYEQFQNELLNMKYQNEEYFYNRYEVDADYMIFTTLEMPHAETNSIQVMHDKLIDFVLVKILSAYIYMLNQKKYGFAHNFKMSFIEHIIPYLKEYSAYHAPAISLLYNLMMLLKDDDEQYYFKLKELFETYPDILDRSGTWTAYVCMVNFCETRVENERSNEKFSKEVNELYRTIIENEIYQLKDWYPFMHHRLFFNVVRNGLYQNEFEWVENFMTKYRDELSEEHKLSTYNLCLALYYFNRKEYEKSLEFLTKVRSENLTYSLHIKALTLQNYYELNLYDNALTAIDAYRHFLKENPDILTRDKTHHSNFAKVVYHLLKIKLGEESYMNDKFDSYIVENTGILERKWLIEKIEEIGKY